MLYGAIEAGGTKMVLAVADENLHMIDRETLPTQTPEETIPRMIAFFQRHAICALGIASFGPVDLNPASETFGYITKTPKLQWRDYPLVPVLERALHVPCTLDTDVNAAALCEAQMGAGKGHKNCVYVTVGTGIGGGVYCEGNLVHGLMHPEVGHMLLRAHPQDPAPDGFCPYHKGCLEGVASGPAIEKRWGQSAKELPESHPAWEMEAHYLAQMCMNLMMTVSPEKIILGGGVMSQGHLFPLIRKEFLRLLHGYIACVEEAESLIVPPVCWPDSGLIGAVLLAKNTKRQDEENG